MKKIKTMFQRLKKLKIKEYIIEKIPTRGDVVDFCIGILAMIIGGGGFVCCVALPVFFAVRCEESVQTQLENNVSIIFKDPRTLNDEKPTYITLPYKRYMAEGQRLGNRKQLRIDLDGQSYRISDYIIVENKETLPK